MISEKIRNENLFIFLHFFKFYRIFRKQLSLYFSQQSYIIITKNDDFFTIESYFNLQSLYIIYEGETKFYHKYVSLQKM